MISIDWAAFAVVLGVSLVAAVGIAVFYSTGLRLLGIGSPSAGEDAESDLVAGARPAIATIGAGLCFAVCIAAVLFGIWLIVPQFH